MQDEPLVSVETAKLIEIPSPYAAKIVTLRFDENTTISVGEVIAEFFHTFLKKSNK